MDSHVAPLAGTKVKMAFSDAVTGITNTMAAIEAKVQCKVEEEKEYIMR